METMPPPMAIPYIRVDGQNDGEALHSDHLQWDSYGTLQPSQEYYDQHANPSQPSAPQPPFKLVTDLPHFPPGVQSHQDQFAIERFVEDQFHCQTAQSAPIRELSPFETCAWPPEPASAITQYQERLSSPDETILSSASGSWYWPSSTFSSNRIDGVSCSSASQDPSMSRRGSAFGSTSAASDVHDPFAWSKTDTSYNLPDAAQSHSIPDMASLGGAVSFAHPSMPSSAQASRHVTPFNSMFNTELDLECGTRASSIPPQPRLPAQHHFRYPSPHNSLQIPVRHSITPGADTPSDYDIPLKSDNDCDSDYVPHRSLRSPRSRSHRPVRSTGSATHTCRPSFANHNRSSSYNSATASTPNPHRVTKRHHARRPSSTSHIPQSSPKTAASHTHNISYHTVGPAVHPPTAQPPRPFSCPLAPYSCLKTFTSKNEWKRHVLTQHLLLGFWRCDLCPDAATRPNDFNRKDLFVQHLRRMHCGDRRGAATVFDSPESVAQDATPLPTTSSTDATNTKRAELMTGPPAETQDAALDRVRRRCWIQLRNPPRTLACAFCSKMFESHALPQSSQEQERDRGCAVEWLEHVGRHLVAMTSSSPSTSPTTTNASPEKKGHKRRKSGSKSDGEISVQSDAAAGFTEPPWERDGMLLDWLVEEGLVERGENGDWIIVERGLASEAAIARKEERGERDAEGDLE
ncbi:MAG: hypothetical protein Q9162_006040 [Coniocarpon cinnabarinum]